jgi:hypothetical protein
MAKTRVGAAPKNKGAVWEVMAPETGGVTLGDATCLALRFWPRETGVDLDAQA